jgi:hypothetical protein
MSDLMYKSQVFSDSSSIAPEYMQFVVVILRRQRPVINDYIFSRNIMFQRDKVKKNPHQKPLKNASIIVQQARFTCKYQTPNQSVTLNFLLDIYSS